MKVTLILHSEAKPTFFILHFNKAKPTFFILHFNKAKP